MFLARVLTQVKNVVQRKGRISEDVVDEASKNKQEKKASVGNNMPSIITHLQHSELSQWVALEHAKL